MFDPKLRGIVYATAAAVLVTGCGADDIASPGTGGNITINNPAPPPPPPPPPPVATVTAAGACPSIADPQGLTNAGTISGPTGSYRVCQLPNLIKVSSTLPKLPGVLYSMNGRVNVGCDGGFTAPTAGSPVTSTTIGCATALTSDTNVNLTIEPGVILFGATGQSWLVVNRGNKLTAEGTATRPIIFTSQDNVAGFTTDSSQGQWGGVVLLGRGITTDCTAGGTVAANTCERKTEGAPDLANFGGRDNTYNAGKMKYVQIRYSGFSLATGSELQALTTGSIGSNTELNYIQSHNSSDDGAEFFGGAVNMKYYVATGADDDSIDIDTGAQANIQFALLIQRAGKGDALMEMDSNDNGSDTPRTTIRIANFVGLQSLSSADNDSAALASTLFRGNSDTTLINGVIATPNNECIRMDGRSAATLTARSVVLQCNAAKFLGSTGGTTNYTAQQVATFFGSGSNNNNDAFTTSFSSLFINGANETGVRATDPTTFSSTFTLTDYIGAVKDGSAASSWYAGWTCNSATATLGTSVTGLCTSLPTY
jgi:hypothetical protein